MSQSLLADSCQQSAQIPTEILRCPVTHSPLDKVSVDALAALNKKISVGEVRHLDGSQVQQPVESALRSADESLLYRVDRGIIVLLPALAIVLDTSSTISNTFSTRADKEAVRNFYENVGWNRSDDGDFVDAEIWEDLRHVSRDYIHKCHMRVKQHLKPAGKYLLDVASGPVQYPEYLSYSADYAARICVDISYAALKEAQRKLGNSGIYVLGDITNLPLREDAVDGAVSLHTIYHVPADEQAQAFREVFRVIKPSTSAVVVYCWRSLAIKALDLPRQLCRGPAKTVRKLTARFAKRKPRQIDRPKSSGGFYYHAHTHGWFVKQEFAFSFQVRSWRSLTVPMMKAYFHRWLLGRAALALLYRLENALPRCLGRFGAYPLIVISKPNSSGTQKNE